MLSTLLSIAAFTIISTLAMRAFHRAYPGLLARRVQAGVGIATLCGATVLVARGQYAGALGLAGIGLWLWQSAGIGWWPFGDALGRGGQGPHETVKTDHLDMEIDAASGRLRGRVIKGFFAGRSIATLQPVELAHLWQDCRFVDPKSAELVESYLDRVHPSWREDMARADANAPKGPDGKMTRAEALEILGLGADATDDDVRRAHRDLIVRFHPDRGGSNYLAAKINEAKEAALGGS